MFVFLPLSLWPLCANTGSLTVLQVQTVQRAAEKAWRGTGKLIHSFIYLCFHLITLIPSFFSRGIIFNHLFLLVMCGIFFSCSNLRNPQKDLRYKHIDPYLWFVLYSKWSFADKNWVSLFYMFVIKQEKKPFFNNREAKLTFYSLCKVMFVQSSLQCCVLAHLWIASGTHHKKEPNFSLKDLAQCTSQENSKNSEHGSGSDPADFSAEDRRLFGRV